MRNILAALRAAAAALVVVLASAASAQQYVSGEILVKYRASSEAVSSRGATAQVGEPVGEFGVFRVAVPRGVSVQSAVARFRAMANVEYAEPNYIATTCDVPNDPSYGSQWALPKVSAPAAWDVTLGSSSVKVAVLDTGVNLSHPDLAGKIVATKDFSGKGTVEDGNGHGTHTAGTVAAVTNNAVGVASLGRNTSLVIGKVLNDAGSGSYSAIVAGIDWAVSTGAKVISMSLGGGADSQTMRDAVDRAWNAGVVVVAAAGNNGNTRPVYPGAYTNCIAVAATDSTDARASFSSYGSWVDCAAPGVQILSTFKGGGYAYSDGTSMATPHVAGLAALVWTTVYGTSAQSVRDRVVTTGDPVKSKFGKYPTLRINALNAVR